jgi:hypothetical protein
MDLDNARMSLTDSEMTLKNEVIEQRRKMSNYEHECINERMVADQLRRDKDMILDNGASIKAVMENIKEENTELSEVNYQLRLRVTEILQGKWDDVANSPNSQVVEELRQELGRLQQELPVKDGRIFEQSATMDKRTTEETTEIMVQRDDAILKNGRLYVELQEANKKLGELDMQRGGAMEVVQSAPPPPHVIP